MKRDAVASIDEPRCIGCARCLEACPVDAIVGASGLMHTIVEPWCIGCKLCLPPCPVDCIDLVPAAGRWTAALARAAQKRYRARKSRLERAMPAPRARARAERRALLAAVLERRRGR